MADELKAFAMSVAAEVLPRELERLSTDELATLQSLCSEDEQTMLVDALASSFVTFLLVPPGDATSKLSAALPEPEKLALAELYWRCIVAVALMPELPSKTSRGTILTCRRGTCVGAPVKQPQLSRGAVS